MNCFWKIHLSVIGDVKYTNKKKKYNKKLKAFNDSFFEKMFLNGTSLSFGNFHTHIFDTKRIINDMVRNIKKETSFIT
jgi:hypothetical protein